MPLDGWGFDGWCIERDKNNTINEMVDGMVDGKSCFVLVLVGCSLLCGGYKQLIINKKRQIEKNTHQ